MVSSHRLWLLILVLFAIYVVANVKRFTCCLTKTNLKLDEKPDIREWKAVTYVYIHSLLSTSFTHILGFPSFFRLTNHCQEVLSPHYSADQISTLPQIHHIDRSKINSLPSWHLCTSNACPVPQWLCCQET